MKKLGVLALGLLMVASTEAALAHKADLISSRRAGPLANGVSNLADAEAFLGSRLSTERGGDACGNRGKIALWEGIWLLLDPKRNDKILGTFVMREKVSTNGGSVSFHTKKGLRIGDGVKRLKKLYPSADGAIRDGSGLFILEKYRLDHKRYSASWLTASVHKRIVTTLASSLQCKA